MSVLRERDPSSHVGIGGASRRDIAAVEAAPPRTRGLQRSEHRLLLTAGDTLCGAVAMFLALWAWSVTTGFSFDPDFLNRSATWLILVPAWVVLMAGSRRSPTALSVQTTSAALITAATVLLVLYLAVYFYAPPRMLPRLPALYFVWEAALLTLAWRLVYQFVFTGAAFRRRAVVVGAGAAAARITSLMRDYALDVDVVAAIADGSERAALNVPILVPAELDEVVTRAGVSEIVVASSALAPETIQSLLRWQERGIAVVPLAAEYEQLIRRVPVAFLPTAWMFTSFSESVRARDASNAAKRFVDIVGALAGLIVLAVVAPVVSVLIWLDSGRPILYRQRRVGAGGIEFELLKFRSMTADAEDDGPQWAGEDDPRATRIGHWLRRARLDEWPQMVNVLRGEMSLVGPRPERPEFTARLERTIPAYRTRLMVRPGLTGWAQINTRYAASSDDAEVKLEYDLYYIKHRSFLFDAWILLKTLGTLPLLRGR